MELKGQVKAKQIAESRFSVSGKIASINVKVFQTVKKGALLATVDKSLPQTYLDRALMQYEKERADFDQKQKETLSEFDKRKIQNELDITVKNVEIAKQNLEETNLYSPIDGVVATINGGLIGENITPARFIVTIIDPDSFYFEAEVEQKDLMSVKPGQEAKIKLVALPQELSGTIEQVGLRPLKPNTYPVLIEINNKQDLKLGLLGIVRYE